MSLRRVLASGAACSPPSWLPDNLCFETITGSDAYGVSSGASDSDVYGICFPPKELVFPHLAGEIPGFGRQVPRFEQWQEHHVEALGKQWDFQVFSIVKFFTLAMENNPNIVDVLFTPRRCVLSSTAVGERIRENRRLFLHKGAWHKFKGYAYSQLHKIRTKTPQGKRLEIVEQHGYDVKFAYHVVRLLLEVEMILGEHDLDLERHREQLKAIRRGEWTEAQLQQWAADKERALEALYAESTLPYGPDEPAIRTLLLSCLEMHYGDLSSAVRVVGREEQLLREIARMTERYR
ncbi:MAG: nucleotidyltransferase domain-containing protein [Kofleriaceae bacterium]